MILHEYENKLLSNNVIALLDLSAPLVLGGLPLTSWSLTSGECPSRHPWQGRLRSPRLFCGLRFGRKASEEQKGHSAYFNTAVTKQDFMKILGVSSQKWCKIISYYHGDVKQTMVYLIAPSVLILIKWDVTKQDFFLVLWLNHLQLLSKIIGYYHGNRE